MGAHLDLQIKVTGKNLSDLIPLRPTVPGANLQPLSHPDILLVAGMEAVRLWHSQNGL